MPKTGRKSSGRKSKAEELGLIEARKSLRLPPLAMDARAVGKYIAAINKALLAGRLDNATARELASNANVVLRAVRVRHQSGELEELEELLRRAEGVKEKARSRAKAERDKTR
jgi:hypothetical protein